MPQPDERRHIPALDGLRGVAVLLVVFYHVVGGAKSANPLIRTVGLISKAGWIGVPLFFVLSGFLITGILWDGYAEPHWARIFYLRRTLRIFPLYFGSLLLVLIASVIGHTGVQTLHGIWVPALFLQNMPRLRNISESLHSPLPIYHLWSLAVEEQFYLLWPFLLSLQRTRRRALMLCLSTIGISALFRIILALFTSDLGLFDVFLLSRADELALGAAIAVLFRSENWSLLTRIAPVTLLLSFTIFVLADVREMTHGFSEILRQLIEAPSISVAFAALVVLAIHPGLFERLFSALWLRWIGSISFGIYIFHVLLLPLFSAAASGLTHASAGSLFLFTRALVRFFVTIPLAWLSLRFYETPFLRLTRRFSTKASITADSKAFGQTSSARITSSHLAERH